MIELGRFYPRLEYAHAYGPNIARVFILGIFLVFGGMVQADAKQKSVSKSLVALAEICIGAIDNKTFEQFDVAAESPRKKESDKNPHWGAVENEYVLAEFRLDKSKYPVKAVLGKSVGKNIGYEAWTCLSDHESGLKLAGYLKYMQHRLVRLMKAKGWIRDKSGTVVDHFVRCDPEKPLYLVMQAARDHSIRLHINNNPAPQEMC